MTWVVAASTLYGYGALFSDVQVTFKNGNTEDILQKAHPISNDIAAGFAGSVQIGFMLLQSLHEALRLSGEHLATRTWDPRWVSLNWPPIAQQVFAAAPAEERALGSRILMVGASPTESAGLGAKIYFTRFADPDFNPGIMTKTIKLCSIGSGSGVSEYKHCIKPLLRTNSGIMRGEIMHPGGWGEAIGGAISQAIKDYPRSGISRHIHMVLVRRGSIVVGQNDEDIYPPGDAPMIQFRMPEVAKTYERFLELAAKSGHDSACAAG